MTCAKESVGKYAGRLRTKFTAGVGIGDLRA